MAHDVHHRFGRIGGSGLAGQQCLGGDPVEERLAVVIARGRPAWIPALVIDSPDQLGQLRRQLRCLIDGETVADRVQDRPQSPIGLLRILGAELGRKLVQPNVRLLDASIDDAGAIRCNRLASLARDHPRFAAPSAGASALHPRTSPQSTRSRRHSTQDRGRQ